jgi:hypothetical protein
MKALSGAGKRPAPDAACKSKSVFHVTKAKMMLMRIPAKLPA